ncbi:MAG: hypothetical protein QOE35_2341 [Actinomycetota bacterium]
MRKLLITLIATITAGTGLLIGAWPARPTSLGPSGSYHFAGAGFGHGVGMSQYGAKAYADGGAGAGSILAKFYTGTALATVAQPALRVWLADVGASTDFNTSGPIVVTADQAPSGPVTVDTTPSGAPAARVTVGADGLRLTQGSNVLLGPTAGPIVIRPEGSPASNCSGIAGTSPCVGLAALGMRFRWGAIEVTKTSNSTMRIVARDLAMEHYLYGLGEMPSSWHVEALKAQAIAGRTYALEKVQRSGQNRPGCACGLLRDTRDQNYIGFEKEADTTFFPRWRTAVDSTAGMVVTYNGAPIQALYHSSSGGRTENNEVVFGGSAIPYLRGVLDPGDEASSPYRDWSQTYSGSELQTWLDANAATTVGTLQAVEVLEPYGFSGRPASVRVIGSSGTKTVSAATFRTVVNAGAPAARELRSTLFQLGWQAFGRGFRGGVFVAGGMDGSVPIIAHSADAGGGPHVVVQRLDGTVVGSFFAYASDFTGGVRVAVCDVDGDGTAEIVTAAGPGGGPHIRIFKPNGQLFSNGFYAYDSGFHGGVYVGCANVDGGASEIVTGAGAGGGPHVKVMRRDGSVVSQFFAFDEGFRGGVRVAGGDLAGDGNDEIVVGAGPGGGPHVRVFTPGGGIVSQFFAYDASFRAGVYVGTTTGSPKGALLTGAGETGGPHVTARRLDGSGLLINQFVFGGAWANGARVGGVAGAVLASTGQGTWPLTRLVP